MVNTVRVIAAVLVTLSLCVVGSVPAFADKQDEKGKGHDKDGWHDKGKGHRERDARDDDRGRHFDDRQRVVVHDYYDGEFRSDRRCPPGLAKKHNGCMPPGQAKKWKYGRPLPRDVVYYELPPPLVVRLPPPPAGHRYVRVAGDILLIAVGTAIVVDAIQDLGRTP